MVPAQQIPVGLGRDAGVQEAVLNGRRGADVLVQELFSCLLGDGFGRHGACHTAAYSLFTTRYAKFSGKKTDSDASCF